MSFALLFQTGTSSGWIVGAAVFFVVAALAAVVAFKILRRTVRMAFRMAIVSVILVIAVLGSLALWWFGSAKTSESPRPRSSQSR
jgi:intracellular septation protein A